MIHRTFWIHKIEQAWKKRSIVWLSGVRRVGKTFLCKSFEDSEYYDCELPRTRRLFEDPETFLSKRSAPRIILDEIHRLPNPSQLLKIGADYFSHLDILATGSSTLGASGSRWIGIRGFATRFSMKTESVPKTTSLPRSRRASTA